MTATYNGTEQKWSKVDGEDFIFYDLTSTVPTPVRETLDFNYLSNGIRITGFIFVGISLIIIAISASWVFIRRKKRIVTASQPQFLYLLCFGATLQAVSLIFASFDEDWRGWSADQLSRTCAAIPWFFVIGYLVQYCAIFSKVSTIINRALPIEEVQISLTFTFFIF